MADLKRVHVIVTGSVQGVHYRQSTCRCAEAEHVVGWVKNLHDGRVEAVLEGAADAVERVLAFMAEGPPHAKVENLHCSDEPPKGEPGAFLILR